MTPLYVDIDALTSKFNSKIDNALGKLDGFADNAQRIGSRLTLTLTTPLLLAANKMKNLASDFEESTNKVDVAFGKSSDAIKDFSKTTLTAFGISSGSALDMAALFGDMATSMGLSQDAAASMSTELVGLAGDLSSFKNVRLDVANTALKAIFTGETESLKNLGVVMTQANLEAFALERGLNANLQTMSEAEKVALRYAYVMDKTKNAQGDFARTGGGAANQTRIFHESLKELGQSFGAIILPYFTKAVTGLNQVIASFNALDENVKRNILIGGGIVAAVGPALLAFSSVAKAITAIGTTLGAMAVPVAIFAAGMAATAAYVLTHWEDVRSFFYELELQFFKFKNAIGAGLYEMGFISKETAFGDIAEGWQKVERWTKGSTEGAQGFVNKMRDAKLQIQDLLNTIGAAPSGGGPGGGSDPVSKLFEGIKTSMSKNLTEIEGEKLNYANRMFNALFGGNFYGFSSGIGSEAVDGMNNTLKSMGDNISQGIDTYISNPAEAAILKFSQKFEDAFGWSFEEAYANVSNVIGSAVGFLGDTLATGLASIFNQDIQFNFKSLVGQFLSAMGDMFIAMATPMITAWTLANIAGVGSFSGNLGAAVGLLGVGVAMKGGGMALSNSSAPSSSVGGTYNQGGYGSGYGTTFSPNITATFGGTVQVVADGTQLKGVLDSTNVRYNG